MNDPTSHVLLVEDDVALGNQLCTHLQQAGLQTRWWQEGQLPTEDSLDGIELVVLDLMIPGVQGLDILKHLRMFSDVPVLILSARDEADIRVRGLQLGADDYMTKPFWPEEFIARVNARLRRPMLSRNGMIKVGSLTIDSVKREARIADQQMSLTRAEFSLLELLAKKAGMPVSRQRLVDTVLDDDRDGDPRGLDTHVSRLRKKMGQNGLIETVWGVGYRLAKP